MTKINFAFFGTSEFSVNVLEALKERGFIPSTIFTFPDKPQGRGHTLQPNPVRLWADIHAVPVSFDLPTETQADVFVVASYGKIIPRAVYELPPHKTLNVHPSLLPKLRGAAPLQFTILQDEKPGVTIMEINEKMDEGPIVAQEEVRLPNEVPHYQAIEALLGKHGGELLANVLPQWIAGEIEAKKQDSSQATYTKKITKADADITNDDPITALRKIRAYEVWPRARLSAQAGLGELIITEAHIENGELILDRVVPPGKKEMDYADYLRGKK